MKGLVIVLFVVSACQLFAEENVYKIGDVGPAGGLIFYVDPSDAKKLPKGQTYLEVEMSSEESDSTVWSNVTEVEVDTKTGIGKGYANTKAIIAQSGHNISAAKVCTEKKNFRNGFLPSKDELNLIYKNLSTQGINGSKDYGYWSSSEDGPLYAHVQYFFADFQMLGEKNTSARIRCIRAF